MTEFSLFSGTMACIQADSLHHFKIAF